MQSDFDVDWDLSVESYLNVESDFGVESDCDVDWDLGVESYLNV